MTIPLVMTGPGGDYTTRLVPSGAGTNLRQVSGPQEYPSDADTESGTTLAGYAHARRRRRRQEAEERNAERRRRDDDGYEPGDAATATATAAEPAARRWVRAGSLAAASSAIDAWLAMQQEALTHASRSLQRLRPAFSVAPPAPRVVIANDQELVRAGNDVLRRLLHSEAAGTAPAFTEKMHHGTQAHAASAENPPADPRLSVDTRLFPDLAGAGRRAGRLQGHRLRARRGVDSQGRAAARSEQGTLFGAHS